jgi:transposase
MKGKTKRKFTADFKLKVVLEVLKEKDTLTTTSKKHERSAAAAASQPDH